MDSCIICGKETKKQRITCSDICLKEYRYKEKIKKYEGMDYIFVQHKSTSGDFQNVIKIRHNCPKCGKDKGYGFISGLKRNCKKCSIDNTKIKEIPHNFYGQRKRITHNKNTYLTRSTFESFYIEYLIKNNIRFLYESETFILKDGSTYLPDFYLIDSNEYVELKGLMRDKDLYKITCFQTEFPDKKLKVLLKSDLEKLGYNLNDYKKEFSFKIKGIEWRIILLSDNSFNKKFESGQGVTDFDNKKVYFNEKYVTDKVILHELGHVFYSSCCTDSVTDISNDDIVEIFCDIISEHYNEFYIQCARLVRLFYNSMLNRYGDDFKNYKLYNIDKKHLKYGLEILKKESKSKIITKEIDFLISPRGLNYGEDD